MTKGENYAIRILVAIELGLKASFKDESLQLLNTGRINPPLIGEFAKEARKCVEWINENNLVDKALQISTKFIGGLKNGKS